MKKKKDSMNIRHEQHKMKIPSLDRKEDMCIFVSFFQRECYPYVCMYENGFFFVG